MQGSVGVCLEETREGYGHRCDVPTDLCDHDATFVGSLPIQADCNISVAEQVLGTRQVQISEVVLVGEQRQDSMVQKIQKPLIASESAQWQDFDTQMVKSVRDGKPP